MIGLRPEKCSSRSDFKSYVLLDRDGVINEDSDAYIRTPQEWIPIEGSLEAIARLTQSQIGVLVITNQSGVFRGMLNGETLQAIHAKMCRLVQAAGGQIVALAYCPHGPDDKCECRKPGTGLVRELEAVLKHPLQGSPFVGDKESDLICASHSGCIPHLVRTGKGHKTEGRLSDLVQISQPITVHDDLASFVSDYLDAIDQGK